jgi:hypothetical protein
MAIEFIECASLSIQYDATGKVSVSFSVIRDDNSEVTGYKNFSFGGVNFDGVIMRKEQQYLRGSGKWYQWQMQWQGVGN